MTRKAGYSLSGVPGARGGAGSDVVDVRSALHPTALHALSLSSTYVSLKTAPDGGGGRAEGGSGAGVGGRKRDGAEGVRGMSDRCGALDVALRA